MLMFLLLLVGVGVIFQTVIRKTYNNSPTVLSATTGQVVNDVSDALGLPIHAPAVTGWLDSVGGNGKDCSAQGWAKSEQFKGSVSVNFYASRLLTTGAVNLVNLGTLVANLPSEAAIGGNGNHRFDGVFTYAQLIRDSRTWNIMAFGVDPKTQKEIPLSGSPKPIICPRVTKPMQNQMGLSGSQLGQLNDGTGQITPIGYLEPASCDRYGLLSVKGWTNDLVAPLANLEVNFYVDYAGYGVTSAKVLTLFADQSRQDVCRNVKGAGCNAGFSGTVNIFKGYYPVPGTKIKLTAKAIDPWSGKEYPLSTLPNTPKEIVCGS